MKNLLLIVVSVLISNQILSQILSPINPIIGKLTGYSLVESDCKICFEIAPAKMLLMPL